MSLDISFHHSVFQDWRFNNCSPGELLISCFICVGISAVWQVHEKVNPAEEQVVCCSCYCHYVAFVILLHKPKFPHCHLLNLPTFSLWAQIISQTLIGVYLDQSMQPAFAPSTWVANDSHMSGLLYWTCFLFNHDHCWQAAFCASEKPFRILLILTKKLSLGGEIEYCLLASE